jgi:hypothetical protein
MFSEDPSSRSPAGTRLTPFQRLSLRHKLPLFLVGLTAIALLMAGAIAWEQVRGAARAAAEARAERTATELGQVSRAGANRSDSLVAVAASHPAVIAALAGRVDSVAVR